MQVDIFEANPEVVTVAHNANVVDVDGRFMRNFNDVMDEVLSPEYLIKGGGAFATNSMMVLKSMLDEKPIWFYKFPAGDSAMVNLSICRGKTYFINEIMSAYRKNVPGSFSSKQTLFVYIKHLISLIKAYRSLVKEEKKYQYLYYKKIVNLYYAIPRFVIIRIMRNIAVIIPPRVLILMKKIRDI